MPCRTDHDTCAQVHLTVDTAMDTGSIKISAFVARKLTLGDRLLARKFQEVECEIDTQEIETVGGAPAAAILPELREAASRRESLLLTTPSLRTL